MPAAECKRALCQVAVKLPLSHLEILDEEARIFGVRRAQFLELLVRRKVGLITFDRPAGAPVYTFTDEQLSKSKRVVWYVHEPVKQLLDLDRRQMGNVTPQAWIVFELNRWLGRPLGLRRERLPAADEWREP